LPIVPHDLELSRVPAHPGDLTAIGGHWITRPVIGVPTMGVTM
jgi:hypothetical protein